MTNPLPNRTQDLPEKRYYDPSTEQNWADILHDVLEELSANSLVSGTDRFEFEPLDGQLFVHTGGGRWYLGDGTQWNDLGEFGGGTGGFEGALVRVNTAEELENALDNTKYIRIDSSIDVSTISPVDVPDDICLYGLGTHRDTGGVNQSAKLFDNSDNPTLQVTGDDVRLFGFAIHNQSDGPSASAVTTEGDSTDISYLDIRCEHDGIVATASGTETPTEPRITACRTISTTGSAGTGVGIRVDGQADATVTNNTVAGFDAQIEVRSDNAAVLGNTTATDPATDTEVGIRIGANNIRASNNNCLDGPATAGIHVTDPGAVILTENLLQVGDGADGIALDYDGELSRSTIRDNLIRTDGAATGNLAINGDRLTGTAYSSVRSNSWDDFSAQGFTTATVAAGAHSTPDITSVRDGDIVRNVDDDAVWANLGGSLHEINRMDGWEALTIVEDPDTGTSIDESIDVDPNYGTYLLAGYINGGATSDNAENTVIDININNNYDTIYDYATREQGQGVVWTTGATSWVEQVWSRGITPISWWIHSGTQESPADADTPWTTINSVCHQGRRGLVSGRDDRSQLRVDSIELYSEIPRFGGRFVLFGIDRDRLQL